MPPTTRQTTLTPILHPVQVPDQATQQALEVFRAEVQLYLRLLAEGIDKMNGLRGTPEFFSPVKAHGNRITGIGDPEQDDDVEPHGRSLSQSKDRKTFDARNLSIINLPLATEKGRAVPFQQLEARVLALLSNPVFTGTVTAVNLTLTDTFRHTGTLFGVFGTAPVTQRAAIADLTDNTGVGAPDSVIENVPASTGDAGGVAMVSAAAAVATVASVNAALTAIENSLADLAAKVDAITAALRTLGFIAP